MTRSSAANDLRPIMHHIPVCPFSQRLEILLELKGASGKVEFRTVDITKPRSEHILKLTGGTTALPVMELSGGRALKESLVLMDFLEALFPEPPIRRADPYERGLENLMVSFADGFAGAGYRLILNRDREKRGELVDRYLEALRGLDSFLVAHSKGDEPWLFDRFGWAEAAFTPFFQRFAFLRYYEGVDIPEEEGFQRVRRWRDASVEHPAAQQATEEEIIKLYYDYAMGHGNGAIPPGRQHSSFAFLPHWKERPMPPPKKYEVQATDAELGLV